MRIGFFGDVMGRAGRRGVQRWLPDLRDALRLDVAIVNAENAAGGFGLSETTANELFDAGADVLTTGNHAWDQPDAPSFYDREPRVLRPVNHPAEANPPGQGAYVYEVAGRRVLVMNVLGRLFMDALDDPFAAVARELERVRLGETVDAIIVDMHAESTSETYAMGHFCDGRVSLVVGTHTHVPTADAHVLAGGTAYQSDAGMCGDYDSVIGMKKEISVARFATRLRTERMTPADGEATVCGVFVETDAAGLATRCEPIRVGGLLPAHLPAEAATRLLGGLEAAPAE